MRERREKLRRRHFCRGCNLPLLRLGCGINHKPAVIAKLLQPVGHCGLIFDDRG